MFSFALVIFLLSIPVGIAGLVLVIKPIPPITKRRVGAGILAGSFVLFWASIIIAGMDMPEGQQPSAAAAAKGQQGERARGAAVPAPKVEKPAGVAQAEYETYYDGVMNALKPCDTAVSSASTAIGAGDVYAAYPVVQRAEQVCLSTAGDVRAVRIPRSAKGEVKKSFEGARESCSMTGTMKWAGMRALAKVLDGDMRPSAVSDAKQQMAASSSYALVCAANMVQIAQAAGLELPASVKAE